MGLLRVRHDWNDLAAAADTNVNHLFIYLFVIYTSPLEKMSIQVLCLFLNHIMWFFVVDLWNPLYILDGNSLSDIWFANVFFQFISCCYPPLTALFDTPKILSLIQSHFFQSYFFLVLFCFWVHCFIYRRRQWHPTPVLLPGKSHGWRSLVGCSP